MKAKNMEDEICKLQKTLEERNGRLQASACTAEKVINFLKKIFFLFQLLSDVLLLIYDFNEIRAHDLLKTSLFS